MVEENEFNNSNLLETNRSYPVLPVMLKTKSSGGLVFSATDTYNLSVSSSSSILESSKTKKQSTDRNEDEEDEPTNPFVQSSPQRQEQKDEVMELSSRYVDEVVSQGSPNLVVKEVQKV